MIGSVNRRWLGKAFAAAAAGAVLLGSTTAGAAIEVLDAVVATVNNDIVLRSEVDERYAAFQRQLRDADVPESQHPPQALVQDRILERLILESIQLQMAEERGVRVDDQSLSEAIGSYASQNDITLEQLRTQLAADGVAYSEFREELRHSMILQRIQRAMVDRLIFITSEEVEAFRLTPVFKEYAADLYRLGHILLTPDSDKLPEGTGDIESKANDLVKSLREGADFSRLAILHSEASTALDGGDMGMRKLSEIPSLFIEKVRDLKPGETADPIRNALGFHIVQVLERNGATLAQEEHWNIRHILIKTSTIKSLEDAKAEITRLRSRIVGGEDFAELAKEFSNDAGSALVGGDLGWTDIAAYVAEFQQAAKAAEQNQLTEPFKTEFGWHILEVLGRRFEDMSEETLNNLALNVLYNRFYSERLEGWLKEIRDEAFVVIVGEQEEDSENL